MISAAIMVPLLDSLMTQFEVKSDIQEDTQLIPKKSYESSSELEDDIVERLDEYHEKENIRKFEKALLLGIAYR